MESPILDLHKGSTYDADILGNINAYLVNAPITPIQSGAVVITKGSIAALTISAPLVSQNGTRIRIFSTTAFAHTITFATVGFNGLGASGDVATFGGAIGDGMTIEAYNGNWYVTSRTNVTLA